MTHGYQMGSTARSPWGLCCTPIVQYQGKHACIGNKCHSPGPLREFDRRTLVGGEIVQVCRLVNKQFSGKIVRQCERVSSEPMIRSTSRSCTHHVWNYLASNFIMLQSCIELDFLGLCMLWSCVQF